MDVNGIINNIQPVSADNNLKDKKNEVSLQSNNQNVNTLKKTERNINDKEGLNNLNKLLEKQNTHAEYSVYKELGVTMIKIIDDSTQDIVMEIPKEKALDAVAAMLKNVGLIDEKA